MRLWSLHPEYLDSKGLVALWREALLAQKVLRGNTKGYRNHPALNVFKRHPFPYKAISYYLEKIAMEADSRGYNFNKSRILPYEGRVRKIEISEERKNEEIRALREKLEDRDIEFLEKFNRAIARKNVKLHLLFKIRPL